jgi:pimeloyl-ACP methyl ester carboxylesterase
MMTSAEIPLLLLPGTLADERVFAPVLERLGLAGASIRMSGAASTAAMAELILARAPEKFALIGFSLGAIVALELLAQAPERIERVALLGCNARALPPDKAAARRATVPVAEQSGTPSYIDGVWDASVPVHRRDDAEFRALLHAMASDTPLPMFREQIEMAIQRVDSRPRLAALDMPALVACGAEDQVCPPELSAEIAEAIPGATLAIVARAGHYLTLDQPDELARLMREWLARPARTTRFPKEFS